MKEVKLIIQGRGREIKYKNQSIGDIKSEFIKENIIEEILI